MNELDYRVAIEALENHVAQTRPIYETAKAIDYLKKAHQEALAKQEQGEPDEFLLRGILASELKCWHRLNEEESQNLIDFVKNMGAKQEQDEPVGVAHLMQEGFTHCIWSEACVPVGTKFYTTPQQRKPLTEEQIDKAWRSVDYTVPWEQHRIDIARAIEAAHGIKE